MPYRWFPGQGPTDRKIYSDDEMRREYDLKEQYACVGPKYVPPSAEELAEDQQLAERWNASGQHVLFNGKIISCTIVKASGAEKIIFSQKLRISAGDDHLPRKMDGQVFDYWQVWTAEAGFICRLQSMPEDFPWMPYDALHERLIVALKEEK